MSWQRQMLTVWIVFLQHISDIEPTALLTDGEPLWIPSQTGEAVSKPPRSFSNTVKDLPGLALTKGQRSKTLSNLSLQSQTSDSEILNAASIIHPELVPCKFYVDEASKRVWRGEINSNDPDVIIFNLQFNQIYSADRTALNPLQWVWVSAYDNEDTPFLHWTVDYGILSFGLLETKVVRDVPVILHITDNYPITNGSAECAIELGKEQTTLNIVSALKGLVNDTPSGQETYADHSFCYMHYKQPDNQSFAYMAALYFRYPLTIAIRHYDCCKITFNYTLDRYVEKCGYETKRWWLCSSGAYFLALAMFMYFPVMLFEVCAWLGKDLKLPSEQYEQQRAEYGQFQRDDGEPLTTEWLLLDGHAPLTFLDTFGYITQGCRQKHPVFMSRLVRVFNLIFIPLTLLVELGMYENNDTGVRETVKHLNKIGNPIGFLSLLADEADRSKNCTPIFGGPIGILIVYLVLGFILLVIPNNLKQVIENGMPVTREKQVIENGMPVTREVSPLFLSPADISELSGINIHTDAGYQKAAAVYRCSIYMLFSGKFWSKVLAIQKDRFVGMWRSEHVKIVKLCAVAGLCVVCLVEIILCVLLYGLPICGCLMITMKGGMVSIANLRIPNRRIRRMMRHICGRVLLSVVVLIMIALYMYAIGLIFLEDFKLIADMTLFCTVAVFTYPSVAFGYIFFFVMLVFYVVRLIKEFGEVYLELLSKAVDISRTLDSRANHVAMQDGHVYVRNLQIDSVTEIEAIHVNGVNMDISTSSLRSIEPVPDSQLKVIVRDDIYGIPRDLFDILVAKHRPINVHLLRLMVKLLVLMLFVGTCMNIVSKEVLIPTSDISEVLHVLFIVAMGMIPHMLEVVFSNASKVVKNDIEMKKMARTITDYWQQ